MSPSTKSLISVAMGLALASAGATWFWGFTVDDALITGRVAHQLASGNGYRFNSDGPIVDAVTPFGFAFLLVPFAAAGPMAAKLAAKWLGALFWVLSAGLLSRRLADLSRRGTIVGLILIATTLPLATWAVAGMETGVVLGLATLGAFNRRALGTIALGVAGAWRPELLPWVLSIGCGRALHSDGSVEQRLRRGALAAVPLILPFAAVATARTWIFGAAYPLAAVAKPADLASGVRYALGALALTGPAWTVLGLGSLRSLSSASRVYVMAAAVHTLALVLVGGDWMPFHRLFVPVLPSLIYAGAELAQHEPVWKSSLRLAPPLFVFSQLLLLRGASARGVEFQRAELIGEVRPLLRGAERVATLDIGWVGASTNAHIVDLAGVTDPSVARLPGGHTTKRLPDSFLESHDVDALVLLVEQGSELTWPDAKFTRGVEARVMSLTGAERFELVGTVPLLGTRQAYVVARRKPARAQAD
jgi:hypothetical protein